LRRKVEAERAQEPLARLGDQPGPILKANVAPVLERIGQGDPKPTSQMVVARARCAECRVIGAVGTMP